MNSVAPAPEQGPDSGPTPQSVASSSPVSSVTSKKLAQLSSQSGADTFNKVFKFLFVGEWKPTIPKLLFWAVVVIFIMGLIWGLTSGFENKPYDPFGTGIRFLQRRDDTGSFPTSLEERQFGSKPLVSQLTSTPEPPNFSEYYGIDASLKNGSVMIERENFENSAISLDELEKANKGF